MRPLALQPLDGAELVVAHGNVVQDGVAGDVVRGVGFGNPAALLADHNGEFGLPVDGVRFLRQGQVIVRADQGFLVLGEQGGVLRNFPAHFLDVVAVVVAHADDLARERDNSFEVGTFEGVRCTGSGGRDGLPGSLLQERSNVGEPVNLGEGGPVLADSHCACAVVETEGEKFHAFLRPSV
jgi:hypothetical protein